MTATTTETGLDAHGIAPRGQVIHNPTTAQLYTHAARTATGSSPTAAHSSSIPDASPAARRRTNSSSTRTGRATASGGGP